MATRKTAMAIKEGGSYKTTKRSISNGILGGTLGGDILEDWPGEQAKMARILYSGRRKNDLAGGLLELEHFGPTMYRNYGEKIL